MRPFVAILGVVAGSLLSLAFGLVVVLMVFWLLRDEHPRFAAEFPEVVRGAIIFSCLAALSGSAFWGTVQERQWRHSLLALLWIGLVLVGAYYWPS